jgi:hypothetical protein
MRMLLLLLVDLSLLPPSMRDRSNEEEEEGQERDEMMDAHEGGSG